MPEVPASHHDLAGSQISTLATISPDGRPQLSAVWFLFEDGTFRISLNTKRQKVKNLRRNPACTLFVIDFANPSRYLEVRGDAELSPDEDYVFADRLGAKYGADVRTIDAPGDTRVAVTIKPTRINAVDISR